MDAALEQPTAAKIVGFICLYFCFSALLLLWKFKARGESIE